MDSAGIMIDIFNFFVLHRFNLMYTNFFCYFKNLTDKNLD